MALRRVFVDWIEDQTAGVRGPRAHHLHRVARLRPGELVEIANRERLFVAAVRGSSEREVVFEIREELVQETTSLNLVLQLAIFRFSRLDWAIEKATELGVSTIVPVAAERSDRRLVEAARKRLGRWQKIAEEAAQQSRRTAPPRVEQPLPLAQVLQQKSCSLRLLLDRESPPLRQVAAEFDAVEGIPAASAILIGPEGGWTEQERGQALQAGYRPAGLGPTVLRSETAAVAAVSVLAHAFVRDAR